MSGSSRRALDPGTEAKLDQLAQKWRVSYASAFTAAVDLASSDPDVVARTVAKVKNWKKGEAVEWNALTIPGAEASIMTLNHGDFISEPVTSPFKREGYGAPSDFEFNDAVCVGSARGTWYAKPKGACRIIGFRQGEPTSHLWADAWEEITCQVYDAKGKPKLDKDKRPVTIQRVWAKECWIAREGYWEDADTGERISEFDKDDFRVAHALEGLITYPSPNRNPVGWLIKGRRKGAVI